MRFQPFLLLFILLACFSFSGCVTKDKGELIQKDIIALQTQYENLQQAIGQQQNADRTEKEGLQTDISRLKRTTQITTASDHVELNRIMRDIAMLNGMIEKNGFTTQQTDLKIMDRLATIEARLLFVEAKLNISPPEEKARQTKAAIQTPVEAYPDNPDKLYKRAKHLMRKEKNTVESRRLFVVFLSKFPKHANADNAQYWIGESYFREKNFHQSVMEFQKVVDKYPRGDALDDALFMLGQSFKKLNMKEDAKLFYEECIDRFPKSRSAKKAKKQLKKLKKD